MSMSQIPKFYYTLSFFYPNFDILQRYTFFGHKTHKNVTLFNNKTIAGIIIQYIFAPGKFI